MKSSPTALPAGSRWSARTTQSRGPKGSRSVPMAVCTCRRGSRDGCGGLWPGPKAEMVRAVIAAVCAAAVAPAPALDSTERAVLAAVDAHNADGLALLERVVNINSGTQNAAGVRAVGQIFRSELDALGFKTEWIDG